MANIVAESTDRLDIAQPTPKINLQCFKALNTVPATIIVHNLVVVSRKNVMVASCIQFQLHAEVYGCKR